MSEDLHDIDDLFRDGLNGHMEDLPPGVWEAVSNDLDKKQASYYKSKYITLKRAALFLTFLCFLGSTYFAFEVWNSKQKAINKRNAEVITINPAAPEKKESDRTLLHQNKDIQAPDEQTEQSNTVSKNIFNNTDSLVISTGIEKQEMDGKKQTNTNQTLVLPTTALIKKALSKERVAVDKTATVKNKLDKNNVSFSQPETATPSAFLKIFPLPQKDYSLHPITLQALLYQPFTLLQKNVSSASKTKAAHGFSLSAFAAPNLSLERLEDDEHLAGPGRNRQEAHREEEENHSFSSGLLVNYELTKNISLTSGISVTSSATSIAAKTIYAKADNNGHTRYELHSASGYVYLSAKGGAQPTVGDSAHTSGTISKLNYISIPALVNYQISVGRFSVFPAVGVGFNVLTSGKIKTIFSDAAGTESVNTNISGLKPTYINGQLSVGIEYGINQTISIGVRPNARFALTPINRETPVKSYQNFLSLETGLRIKF